MNEVEEAKKRGYIVFKSSQRASRLGPYSSWCKDTLSPQIYVQITGKGARTEIDLIFVPYDREQVSDALREAIIRLYQANADGDEHFVQKGMHTIFARRDLSHRQMQNSRTGGADCKRVR